MPTPNADDLLRTIDHAPPPESQVSPEALTPFQVQQLLVGRGEECVLAGRYHLTELLGTGGMGAVFVARDTQLNRIVAIKVMAAPLLRDPGAVARFQREARALAHVCHPAIVQAYDVGQDREQHYLVMEYVPGMSLAQSLKEEKRIPPLVAANYIYQVALGLQHAHAQGLVHRDIKPANLLLTPQMSVKILDLGLARFVQDQIGEGSLTREGMGIGTPNYMAPEQFTNACSVDPRADIYSLGCTLYHLLAGEVPFPGSSLSEKARAHAEAEPPSLEERCPAAPAGLVQVVRRMMAKRPADRFQTAGELADALAIYVGDSAPERPRLKTTAANPCGLTASALPKRMPRAMRLAVATAAAAAGLVLIALITFWGTTREKQPGGGGPSGVLLVPSDPNVLSVAQDGTGQFRTLGEAVTQVKPGQTIRVLDAGTYEETVQLSNPEQHAGITLEAVQKATIKPPTAAYVGLLVQRVPNVTVRGFRLEVDKGETQFASGILGKCPGVLFDDLHFTCSRRFKTCAISLKTVELPQGEPPVTVQNCTIHGFQYGIRVEGTENEFCRSIRLRDNKLFRCGFGIWTSGWITDLHITTNQVWECGTADIELDGFTNVSSGILMANNTLQNLGTCLQIRDPIRGVREVEIRNNVLLTSEGLDIAFLGKDQTALKEWLLGNNWRQVRAPAPRDRAFGQWVRSPKDTVVEKIKLLSLDPQNTHFLRPARESPLATGGAGGDLPGYVGAVPPEGVMPWDWDRSWKARVK
jgi:hypothetical protein